MVWHTEYVGGSARQVPLGHAFFPVMVVFVQFQGLVGVAIILCVARLLAEDRGRWPTWRWIAGALGLQLLLALLITRAPMVWDVIGLANTLVLAIEKATLSGSSYLFGYTGGAPVPFELKAGASPPLVIAFQVLPLVIVFSALSALLWHWGVLSALVRGISWCLRRSLGVSGVVGLAGGANLFLGVVEAPLVIRAWVATMSRAELFAVMVLGMSTISGAVLVLYAQTLSVVLADAVGHMISASLISLPAAILMARLLVPGDGQTRAHLAASDLEYGSSFDAIIRGALDGMQLFLSVIAVILVLFALIALTNQMLAILPFSLQGEPLTVNGLLGWLLSPLMWALGVPWSQAADAGALMGTKAILNEYVAYVQFAQLPVDTFDPRSRLIVVYALCGFANLASIGLLVSTLASFAPERRQELSVLGVKSWLAGNLATALTGAIIGLVTWI